MSLSEPGCREDLRLVARAADFAARRHAAQQRKGTAREPYVNHLAEVAHLLAETAGEPEAALVAAGRLHDTLEDTQTDREALVRLFGPRVADLVAEVTDDTSLPKPERKRRQVEAVPRKSPGAKAIKIADETSNLRSLAARPPAGCRGTHPALEDLFDRAAAEARGTL